MEPSVEERSRKRARTSADASGAPAAGTSSESASTPQLLRSTEFWLSDGSIILQAEWMQFRIHQSILSRHSTVFKDMFEIPQPSRGESTVEGCLVVHLSDTAEDVGLMLTALYDQGALEDEKPTFARISAMLRLGKKCDIHYQYNKAVRCLQSAFPDNLPAWRNQYPLEIANHFEYRQALIFDVINLALETGTLSILPAAYLELYLSQRSNIFSGALRYDGTTVSIPWHAQQACVMGHYLIQDAMYTQAFVWLDESDTADECITIDRSGIWIA